MIKAQAIAEAVRRVKHFEGDTFHQHGGKAFTYTIHGETLRPSTTNQNLGLSQLQKALEMMPVGKVSDLKAFRGSSFLYGILMDERIRHGLY